MIAGEKCGRCGTEFKEINGLGCFVEYKLVNKDKGLIKIRGLYDGTANSYMELYPSFTKHKFAYDLRAFERYCKMFESVGYEITEMRSENYKYLECKCDLSVTGEPLGVD